MARSRRRPGPGSITTFLGAVRHWREALHPRDADGRFVDTPDWYVRPRELRGHGGASVRNKKTSPVRDWPETQPWLDIRKRDFDVPSVGERRVLAWHSGTVMGSSSMPGFYLDDEMPAGRYARMNDDGNILVSSEFFDLTPQERRHALYAAAMAAHGGSLRDSDWRRQTGFTGGYRNVFSQGMTAAEAAERFPDLALPPLEGGELLREETIDLDFAQLPSVDFFTRDPDEIDEIERLREEFRLGAKPLPLILDEDGAISRQTDLKPVLALASLFPPQVYPMPALTVQQFDPDRPTSLNGKETLAEVVAEGYAVLADGDGWWLDQNYPGLAPLIRREAVAVGLPVDDGEILPPENGDGRFAFGPEPHLPEYPVFRDGDSIEGHRAAKRAFDDELLSLVSTGDLDPEDAAAYLVVNRKEWHPLPPTLYHVATNAPAIIDEGFKTREQLDMGRGIGLGGGPGDLISFTDDEAVAENIYSSLLEGRAFASGDLTLRDLYELDAADRWGAGSGAVFTALFASRSDAPADWVPGAPVGEAWDQLLDAPPSDDQWGLFKEFIFFRQQVGGPTDPLFFSTDWEALGKLDPADFAILEIATDPRTFGQQVSGLSEWRLHPDALPDGIETAIRPVVGDDALRPTHTVYRGLEAGVWTGDDVARLSADPASWLASVGVLDQALGEHWSGNFAVAQNFSRGLNFEGEPGVDFNDYDLEDDQRYAVGVTIQAQAPASAIPEPGTRMWQDWADTDGIFTRDHPENEFTVERGSPVSVEAVMLTVTDLQTGEYVEEWVDLADLARVGAPTTASAMASWFKTDPGQVGSGSARFAGLSDSMKVAAMTYMGTSGDILAGRVTNDEMDDIVETLTSDENRFAAAAAAGFDVPGYELAIPMAEQPVEARRQVLATLLVDYNERLKVSTEGVFYELPDGTLALWRDSDEVLRALHESTSPVKGNEGNISYALARAYLPDALGKGSNYELITNPDDVRGVLGLIGSEVHPGSVMTEYFLNERFRYDRNSPNEPNHRILELDEAREALAFLPDDIADEMATTYSSLVDRFWVSNVDDGVGFPAILPYGPDAEGFEAVAEGELSAYVTNTGALYINTEHLTPEGLELIAAIDNVAVPTPEGIMAHEFAHLLFAGQQRRAAPFRAASAALESANAAAGPLVPFRRANGLGEELSASLLMAPNGPEMDLGPGNVLRGAQGLSPYAGTHPAEAYAELFAVYITDPDAPEWVKVWGTTFERSFRQNLFLAHEHPDQVRPVTASMLELNGGRGPSPMMLGEIDDTSSFASRLMSVELMGRLAAERSRSGGRNADDGLQFEAADATTAFVSKAVLTSGDPLVAPQWEDLHGRPSLDDVDRIEVWGTTAYGEEESGIVFTINSDGFQLRLPADRAVLELAAQTWSNYSREDRTDLRMTFIAQGMEFGELPTGDDLLPPLVGPEEIKGFIGSIAWANGVSFEDSQMLREFARDGLVDENETLAEVLYASPPDVGAAVRSALVAHLTDDGDLDVGQIVTIEGTNTPVGVNTNLSRAYTESHAEAIASVRATAIAASEFVFEPRGQTISELRAEKLAKVYGADFEAEIRQEIALLPHAPFIQWIADAEDQGYDDLEEYLDANPEMLEHITDHFSGFATTATIKGELLEVLDDGTPVYEEIEVPVVAQVDETTVSSDAISLSIVFYNPENGDTIGESSRTISTDGSVGHGFLAIQSEYRGTGVSYAWNRYNDAWYIANGLTNIGVSAALSDGGYAWASDFFIMGQSERDRFRSMIHAESLDILAGRKPATTAELASATQALADLQYAEDEGINLTGWELAHLGYHPDVVKDRAWIGRRVMRGNNWTGSKNLTALLHEGGVDVESLAIPSRFSGGRSARESWTPYWRNYSSYTDSLESGYPADPHQWLYDRVVSVAEGDSGDPSIRVSLESDVNTGEFTMAESGHPFFIPSGSFVAHATVVVDARALTPQEAAHVAAGFAGGVERGEIPRVLVLTLTPDDVQEVTDDLLMDRQMGSGPANLARVVDPIIDPVVLPGGYMSDTGAMLIEPHKRDTVLDRTFIDSSIQYALTNEAANVEVFDDAHLGQAGWGMLTAPLFGENEIRPGQSDMAVVYNDDLGHEQVRVEISAGRPGAPVISTLSFTGGDDVLTDDDRDTIVRTLMSYDGLPTTSAAIVLTGDEALQTAQRLHLSTYLLREVVDADGSVTFVAPGRRGQWGNASDGASMMSAGLLHENIANRVIISQPGTEDSIFLEHVSPIRRNVDGNIEHTFVVDNPDSPDFDYELTAAQVRMKTTRLIKTGALSADMGTVTFQLGPNLDREAVEMANEVRDFLSTLRTGREVFIDPRRLDDAIRAEGGSVVVDFAALRPPQPWIITRAHMAKAQESSQTYIGDELMRQTFRDWMIASHPDDPDVFDTALSGYRNAKPIMVGAARFEDPAYANSTPKVVFNLPSDVDPRRATDMAVFGAVRIAEFMGEYNSAQSPTGAYATDIPGDHDWMLSSAELVLPEAVDGGWFSDRLRALDIVAYAPDEGANPPAWRIRPTSPGSIDPTRVTRP